MRRKTKIILAACVICVGLAAAGGTAAYLSVHRLYSAANYMSKSDVDAQRSEWETGQQEQLPAAEREGETWTAGGLSGEADLTGADSGADAIPEELTEYLSEDSVIDNGDVYNVLLIGVDRRDDSWAGNSDSMILVSLNQEKKQLSLISLMRDMYVEIPDVGMNRLNAAHAYGAGPLLLETISENFQIQADRYIRVDFEAMIDIIDRIGKMQIAMSDDEVIVANDYIRAMCESLDRDPQDYLIPEGGTVECDGMRAVAYARIRYVGNYDYQRTERQRLIMTNLIQELSAMNLFEIYDVALDIMPLVTHNIPESDIWGLLLRAADLFDYTIVQDRVPYDGLYENQKINGQDVLVVEWEETIERLRETIYG